MSVPGGPLTDKGGQRFKSIALTTRPLPLRGVSGLKDDFGGAWKTNNSFWDFQPIVFQVDERRGIVVSRESKRRCLYIEGKAKGVQCGGADSKGAVKATDTSVGGVVLDVPRSSCKGGELGGRIGRELGA